MKHSLLLSKNRLGLRPLCALVFGYAVFTAAADTVTVTIADDIVDGDTSSIPNLIASPGPDGAISLREAVDAANNTPGADEVLFAAALNGTPITIDLPGTAENLNADGDLDITDPAGISITGNGENNTVLDGNADERAIECHHGSLSLSGLTIRNGKETDEDGGGIVSRGGDLIIGQCTFHANVGKAGGGVSASHRSGTKTVVTGSTFSNNQALGSRSAAGGLNLRATDGTYVIERCLFTGNVAESDGGALETNSGSNSTATIRHSFFIGNTSGNNGGAISHDANNGLMVIDRCTIEGNTAQGNGGGIDNDGTLLIIRSSTISGNNAVVDGGGIYHDENNGTLTLINSTLSGNRANGNGGGVVHDASTGGLIEISYTTITENIADGDADGSGDGGGIDISQNSGTPTITLQNSILQGNDDETPGQTATDDCANSGGIGVYVTTGGNVFGLNTGCSPGASDTSGDAMLGVLADNGGPSATHALLAGSAAINFTTGTPDLDQRGAGRLDGSPDTGAFEAGARIVIVTTAADVVDGDTSSLGNLAATPGADGAVSLREAITAANNTPGGDSILFSELIDGIPIVLHIGATGESANVDGDLDILDSAGLAISGNGNSLTIIDGNLTERVIHKLAGHLILTDLTVRNGRSTLRGGGIYAPDETLGDLILTRCTVNGNKAGSLLSGEGRGGGICYESHGGTASLNDSTISGNEAGRGGGGLYHRPWGGFLFMNGCEVLTNTCADSRGGGIALIGTGSASTIEKSTISGNSSTGFSGGGIACNATNGSLTIRTTTISGNSCATNGAGLEFDSSFGTLVIESSTFTDNEAGSEGGGIDLDNGTTATLTNVTISGNRSDGNGGGVVANNSALSILLDHVTVTLNTADNDADGNGEGGGLDTSASGVTIQLRNSVVQGNDDASPGQDSADDCGNSEGSGNYVSLGGNVFGSGTGCAPGASDTTGPAKLLPLSESSEIVTEQAPDTHRIADDSAALNFAAESSTSLDQRGFSRNDGLPDAGAVEFQFGIARDRDYSDWAASKGLIAGVNDGIFEDPNEDGYENFTHFALDTDPLGDGSDGGKINAQIADEGGQNYFSFTFPTRRNTFFSGAPPSANRDGIIYTVLADDDLAGSDLIAVERSVLSAGLPALSSSDWEYNTFRLPIPFADLKRGFIWISTQPLPAFFESQ